MDKLDLETIVRTEKSVLGSMLRLNDVIEDVSLIVQVADFHKDAHQRIFRAMLGIREQSKPVDLVTLADELHRSGQLEDIGGYASLSELWDVAPTAANAEYYAGIVREESLCRSLGAVGRQIAADVEARLGPARELLEGAEKRIYELSTLGYSGQAVWLQTVLGETFDRIDARSCRGEGATSVLTGFLDLDYMTSGLQPSELIVLAARPSVGKTSLALCIARNVVERGLPVLFVSLEQSRIDLVERMLASESRVDSHRLRRGQLSEQDRRQLTQARDALHNLPLIFDDYPGQTMSRIASNTRRLAARHGVKLVVVDYLQLIEPEDRRLKRHEQVGAVSRRLKHLARELEIPVLALAQLNRASEDRQDGLPRLSDLRESGSIEADADTVLLMHRGNEENTVIDLYVAKQRNGPTGDVSLAFRKDLMRFENFALPEDT